ncbi:hypothetical protein GGI43DRAFT_270342 [Trichoderma evansii]
MLFCVSAGRRASDGARAKRVRRRVLERHASTRTQQLAVLLMEVDGGTAVLYHHDCRTWRCHGRTRVQARPPIHPSNAMSEPTRRLLRVRLGSGVAAYTQTDGACGWMTLLALVSALDMAVFYSKHFSPVACSALCFCRRQAAAAAPRATGLRRQPRALHVVKPAAMALPGWHTLELLRAYSSSFLLKQATEERLGSSDDGIP